MGQSGRWLTLNSVAIVAPSRETYHTSHHVASPRAFPSHTGLRQPLWRSPGATKDVPTNTSQDILSRSPQARSQDTPDPPTLPCTAAPATVPAS
jgi:hypothetical protein